MNFEEFKKLIGNESEVIRMEQSLYVGKRRPLDAFAIPFDNFSDVCMVLEESENMFEGMEVTILSRKSGVTQNHPQYRIRLMGGKTNDCWKLVESGVYGSVTEIEEVFTTETTGGKTYYLYKIVPLGYEFISKKIEEGREKYARFRCIAHDDANKKIILDEVKTDIMIGGPDLSQL